MQVVVITGAVTGAKLKSKQKHDQILMTLQCFDEHWLVG